MNRFAELLDRLAYEPGRNNKLRLITNYFRATEDPDRGYALAALTGALSFKHAKPGLIRDLIADRTDPVLFALSYDYVGDLSETVALMWPKASLPLHNNPPPPTLTDVVTTLRTLGKTELPKQLARWLDELDETGRWALLKLVTGAMRIGISARLAKTAAAALGDKDPHDLELMWPGLTPPYLDLFAWLEGRADKPVNLDPAPFRPVMLAHAIENADFANLDAADYVAEWKWDGIRAQAVSGRDEHGNMQARLYSRSGEDITKSFPDLLPSLHLPGAIDGELLVLRDGRVQTFNVLQQRLNRKVVSPKLLKDYPIHLRAYDLLGEGDTDLRELPFAERRERLEAFVRKLNDPRIDLSPTIAFDSWEALRAARADPSQRRGRRGCRGGRGGDAQAARCALSAGSTERPMVEMEARPAHHRCRPDVCPARPRQALVLLFRLHVRGLDQEATTASNWCRSARLISASPTRSCCRSTASSAATPPRNSDRSVMSFMNLNRDWCWKSPSKDWRARRDTNPAWRCGFRASTGCAGTSRRARPTGWKRWSGC